MAKAGTLEIDARLVQLTAFQAGRLAGKIEAEVEQRAEQQRRRLARDVKAKDRRLAALRDELNAALDDARHYRQGLMRVALRTGSLGNGTDRYDVERANRIAVDTLGMRLDDVVGALRVFATRERIRYAQRQAANRFFGVDVVDGKATVATVDVVEDDDGLHYEVEIAEGCAFTLGDLRCLEAAGHPETTAHRLKATPHEAIVIPQGIEVLTANGITGDLTVREAPDPITTIESADDGAPSSVAIREEAD